MKNVFWVIFIFILAGCSANNLDESNSNRELGSALPIIIGDGSGNINPGETAQLTWQVDATQPSTVFIEASYDGGKTWHTVEMNVVNSGSYEFQTPDIPGAEFRVRVVGVEDQVIAESEDISITGSTRPITVSGGQSTVSSGESVQLTWEVNDSQPATVALQMSQDGGTTYSVVESSITNDGDHTYSLPDNISGSIILQIIDPVKGFVIAQTQTLSVLESASGFPGLAIMNGGKTIQNNQYKIQGTLGEPVQGSVAQDSGGVYRVQYNLIGVTQ